MKTSEPTKISEAINHMFAEVSQFSVIALTGRTGSGCSTAARLLSSPTLPLPETGASHFKGNEARKYRIIKDYIDKKWTPFKWLQVKSIITRFILELNYNAFTKLVAETLTLDEFKIRSTLDKEKHLYEEMHGNIKKFLSLPEDNPENIKAKKSSGYDIYYTQLPQYAEKLRTLLNEITRGAYTAIYQRVGDNIRASGKADSSQFAPDKMFLFASVINKAIKCAHHHAKEASTRCLVVIDAIRNPYEAIYLRERYSDFYVVAVNTSNENRLRHLKNGHEFTDAQIKELDEKEYPKSLKGEARFTSQDIQRCIELADIHINNPRDDLYGEAELATQLAWYSSLIMHPGLVMPTSMETCMQIAYSAKKSSGCISRQVGAVVTDSGFSVKSVGWNNSPQGQVPCLLRSAKHLINGIDASAYSKYERNDEKFRDGIKHKFNHITNGDHEGLNLAYCFKDIQNEIEGEKNQVHTRSLHAEENAFLQISKNGGQPIFGGILFTTASPCELCAKKAFQLGISKIYYIDPYPGIATSHVLEGGEKKPELILFRGAIGTAFHKLYQPIMPFKDELELKFSLPKRENKKETRIKILESEKRALQEKIAELEMRLSEKK
jgi:dCMP deaminase